MKHKFFRSIFVFTLIVAMVIQTSLIEVFATEDSTSDSSSDEENITFNVYDADSFKTYLQTENADIVLWRDITVSDSVEALCNSIDLNGYNLTFSKLTLASDGKSFSFLDSAYNSKNGTSTGAIVINDSLIIGNNNCIIEGVVITVSNGISGGGDLTIHDGVVTVNGKNGTAGVDGWDSNTASYVTSGGDGTDGTSGTNAIMVSNLYLYGGNVSITGGNGGRGGSGGNGRESDSDGTRGGSGGNGGNAGSAGLGIYATSDVIVYGGTLVVTGGRGGRGGNGGNGGDYGYTAGYGGNGGSNNVGGSAIQATNFIIYAGLVAATGGDAGTLGLAGHSNEFIGLGDDVHSTKCGKDGLSNGNGGAGIDADFTMYGGEVTAIGGNGAAGIGGPGYVSKVDGHNVNISGGKVIVTAGTGAFDIGGGYNGTEVGAGGTITVIGGTVEFSTYGNATNVSAPVFKNCTITGSGAYQHEGTYDQNGKFSIAVQGITISPQECVGYDKVSLQATIAVSRTSNISTPAPRGSISFKFDGTEIGIAAIENPIASEGQFIANATIDWIAVEDKHLITAEYIAGTNDKYASAGIYELYSNIAEHAHDWEDDFTVDLPPSCATVGSKSIHCKICDAKKDVTEIPTTGHNFINNQCEECKGSKLLVVFKNHDGTVLSSNYYCIGDTISVPAAPTRNDDNTYTYSFIGWDKEIVECDGDKEYIAVYEPIYKNYTVIFKNYDNSIISTNSDYHYGDAIVVPSAPKKPSDDNYSYVFVGWDKPVTNCYGNAEYIAKFEANDLPIVAVGNASARANENVVVDILLSNAPNLESLAISDILYNTTAFELIDFEWKIPHAELSYWDTFTGKGALALSSDKNLNGTIISLTFNVKDGTADGNYPISCVVTSQECDFKNVAGQIIIHSVIPGDVNGNDVVDKNDAIYLLMHSFFPEDYPINQNADYNRNGMIDKNDAIHLLMYTFFPDDYPLFE